MDVNVSVAMAVYNGEAYIREQIETIISQLNSNDELVISYNKSTDRTWEIIQEYSKNDNRIRCCYCEKRGIINNFENALLKTRGNYIFMCDQDDIWAPKKVELMVEALQENNVVLAMHNCEYIDAKGKHIDGDLFERRNAKPGLIKNLIRNSYQGSCMAFKRFLLSDIIPIPKDIAMHDQWIGLIAEKKGLVKLVDEPLIKYRRHSNAASDINVKALKKVKQIFILYTNLRKIKK